MRRKASYPMVAAFDLLVCLLLMFVILALVSKPKATPMRIDTLGVIAVTLSWPSGSNDDVDLYVEDPVHNIAYFKNTSAGLMHLEQDDLGTANSGVQLLPSGQVVRVERHLERTIIRGAVPGEYTVNVQMYAKGENGPAPVVVTLYRLRGDDATLLTKKVVLSREGDEATAFRFTLTSAGTVTGSNTLPKNFVGDAKPGLPEAADNYPPSVGGFPPTGGLVGH